MPVGWSMRKHFIKGIVKKLCVNWGKITNKQWLLHTPLAPSLEDLDLGWHLHDTILHCHS